MSGVMQMKIFIIMSGVIVLAVLLNCCNSEDNFRRILVKEYQSKMKAGWLGQMAGVGWGAPTEFDFNGMIIPEDNVPEWKPHMINQHYQDDLYVEMTFLKTLEDYGFDVSIRQAGIDFANSRYQLWHANLFGRYNLRSGIAAPYSGHPEYNAHADDIDYQIESDFSGLIAPGMPQTVIELGNKFGAIMNYGDGLYGGQFVGTMYAEAFFESNINQIIQTGLASIPTASQYAETIRDVIKWHKENPDDWQKTWRLIEDKYNLNHDYRKFSCSGTNPEFNIDAKINGAYIVMGLLYGNGDMDQTIIISMRCGQDSDCNPSNAAGILATSMGLEKLPDKFQMGIDDTTKFSYTAYDFPSLLKVCEKLSRQAVINAGGRIERNSDGLEEYLIPKQILREKTLEQSWTAEELTENVYLTQDELDQILVKARKSGEYVNEWLIAGPFTQEGVVGVDLFDVKFDPEVSNTDVDWQKILTEKDGHEMGMLNFEKFFGTINSVAYVKTKVWMEREQNILLELGSDDGVKLWLNDKLVHFNNAERGHEHAADIIEANMIKGWNTILMKITQGVGGWGASLVITDLDHKIIDGIKYNTAF